jgi:ribosomal protein S27AE
LSDALKPLTLVRKEVMNDGDDGVKQCPECGEGVYLFDIEDVKLCPRCGDVVFHFARRD